MKKRWADVKPGDRVVMRVNEVNPDNARCLYTDELEAPIYIDDPDAEVEALETHGADGRAACRATLVETKTLSDIHLGQPIRGLHLHVSAANKAKLVEWFSRDLMGSLLEEAPHDEK